MVPTLYMRRSWDVILVSIPKIFSFLGFCKSYVLPAYFLEIISGIIDICLLVDLYSMLMVSDQIDHITRFLTL